MVGAEPIALAMIDGTGPDDPDYEISMSGSFCCQIAKLYDLPAGAGYWRGPSNIGSGLEYAVDKSLAYVTQAKDAGRPGGRRIVLVGYSRGGLGCILAAHRLKADKRDVYGLVLLDPVDRYIFSSPWKPIPNNVQFSFRAFRSLETNVVLKWEGTLPKGLGGVAANPMRPGFSSAGLSLEAGPFATASNHEKHCFVGSHGALGGSGYSWLEVDKTCQEHLTNKLQAWWRARIGDTISLDEGWDKLAPSPRQMSGPIDRLALAAGRATTRISLTISSIDHMVSSWRDGAAK